MVLVEKEDADKANLLADFYFSIYTEEIDEGPGVSNKIYNECEDITLTTQLVHLPGHLPGRPPVHQTVYDDNRKPVG